MIKFDFDHEYTNGNIHYCFDQYESEDKFKKELKKDNIRFFCGIVEKLKGKVYIVYHIYTYEEIDNLYKLYLKINEKSDVKIYVCKYRKDKIIFTDKIRFLEKLLDE